MKKIIEHEGVQYEVVRVVSDDPKVLKREDFLKWSDEKYCLEAVKRNGYALQYVKEQSEAICLEAVKEDGYALQYVKEQSEAICLEAVKRNGDALQYVKEQTVFEKCLVEIYGDDEK